MPSGYMCQGNMTGSKVVDPNDGFGSNLLTSWVKPTAPGMNQPVDQFIAPLSNRADLLENTD